MPASPESCVPVTLSYWPTCEDALAWSEEDLAVAAGESVHILTPRGLLRAHEVPATRQWYTSTHRVNQFEPSEWPSLDMATLKHFALGEELSESTVVSLAWSPPGLGLYRRSVLAVLTSNLVLSLWETNGTPGLWKRTCIVNQHMAVEGAPEKHAGESRPRKRARAFCWLPTTAPGRTASSWAPQHLAIADDGGYVSIFRVEKGRKGVFGHWSVDLMAQQRVRDVEQSPHGPGTGRGLQSLLARSSPASKLETSQEWQHPDLASDGSPKTECLTLKVSFGQCCPASFLSVRVERMPGNAAEGESVDDKMQLSVEEPGSRAKSSPVEPPPASLFKFALQKARADFDKKFDLEGQVRVRNWGAAFFPDKSLAAVCISLHPSDMIEYGAPRTQHTLLLFARTQQSVVATQSASTDSAVHEEILAFLARCPTSWIRTEMDRNIARNTISLISHDFADDGPLINWAASAASRLSNSRRQEENAGIAAPLPETDSMDLDRNALTENGHKNASAGSLTREVCEICGEVIPFSRSSTSAACAQGHRFSRCGLSFVAIQEPGISKYCSKCGRQFLDPSKLEWPDGPSLSQVLFDKFDVCPYCQGKFRG